jgi:hypothetical protein
VHLDAGHGRLLDRDDTVLADPLERLGDRLPDALVGLGSDRRDVAPSSIVRMPSRTIAWASTVAVVVPSPVRSLVLLATSRTSCAPMFLNGSSSSISRAIETPSLVIVGAPVRRSSTTLRPFGPSVTFTVSASSSTPACSRWRASWLKYRILPIA